MNGFLQKGVLLSAFLLLVAHGSNVRLYQIHFDLETFSTISLFVVILAFGCGAFIQWRFDQAQKLSGVVKN